MTRPISLAIALPLAFAGMLALAACNRPDQGTSVTINADGGNVLGAVDGRSGEVKLDVPGFSGKISLPKVKLDAGNFDLNGVHLYPGSTIDNVDVTDGNDAGRVHVAFTSPASPATVQQWFRERLNRAGFKVAPGGNGLVGTTDENKPFALDLSADGPTRAKGRITLGS